MKKFFATLLVLAVLGIGFYFYDQKNKRAVAPAPAENGKASQPQNTAADKGVKEPDKAPKEPDSEKNQPQSQTPALGEFNDGSEMEGPAIVVKEIVYNGASYEPNSVDIKAGDWIFFKNNSDKDFWPASSPHPSHTDYPEFDPKKPIAPGGKYKFEFAKTGVWKFHDHLNPSARGVVNVANK